MKWKKSTATDFKPTSKNPCRFCGKTFHRFKTCPATEPECRTCNKKGHWAAAKACTENKSKEMNYVQQNEEVTEDERSLEGLYLEDSRQ